MRRSSSLLSVDGSRATQMELAGQPGLNRGPQTRACVLLTTGQEGRTSCQSDKVDFHICVTSGPPRTQE